MTRTAPIAGDPYAHRPFARRVARLARAVSGDLPNSRYLYGATALAKEAVRAAGPAQHVVLETLPEWGLGNHQLKFLPNTSVEGVLRVLRAARDAAPTLPASRNRVELLEGWNAIDSPFISGDHEFYKAFWLSMAFSKKLRDYDYFLVTREPIHLIPLHDVPSNSSLVQGFELGIQQSGLRAEFHTSRNDDPYFPLRLAYSGLNRVVGFFYSIILARSANMKDFRVGIVRDLERVVSKDGTTIPPGVLERYAQSFALPSAESLQGRDPGDIGIITFPFGFHEVDPVRPDQLHVRVRMGQV